MELFQLVNRVAVVTGAAGGFGAAIASILSDAGASRILTETGQLSSRRDPVDLRVVNDVIQGTGKIIDEPREVGGWPALAPGIAPKDSDHDGACNSSWLTRRSRASSTTSRRPPPGH